MKNVTVAKCSTVFMTIENIFLDVDFSTVILNYPVNQKVEYTLLGWLKDANNFKNS
jgi:hypothetical protein